ncbi:inward rectifier potassium channel 16 [Betta splendens]|uniref:Inward rectifier potassium channel 16 n=1 Tax=Betta splendens TaxID=158456 RepID=A0A6P7L4L5_BETSP|nr:inward rectifier potassium channel 16 [Betta splendens]
MNKQYTSVSHIDDITIKKQNGPQAKKYRYIRKEGNCNVVFRHGPEEWLLFVTDIFTSLVEIRWRVMFLIFALSYILSWLLFGIVYWVIALVHGDVRDSTNGPCIFEVRSFTAAFLFSLETQTTIGYGFRGMSENCMVAIVLVTVQDVLSCFIDTFVIGIVVAKMASAKKRAQTVGFSSCAVINLRDGFLCLSWRVGDFRRYHLVEGTAHAQIVRSTVHASGKVDVTYKDLLIQQKDVALVTPTIIFHRIDAGSPLYKMNYVDLRKGNFELVVSFTYTDDTTGMLHQTRTSYSPDEILWGQMFQEMIKISRRHYKVDYTFFNLTTKVPVPEVSAEEYDKMQHSPEHRKPFIRSSPAQQSDQELLKPPMVTVELVSDTHPEPHASTSQAEGQQVTLTLSSDIGNTEI